MDRTCKKHGKLKEVDIIKKGKHKSGNQAYRCKKCMKELHDKNYQHKKTIISEKQKKYREENKEKVKEFKKNYEIKFREKNRENKRERDRKLNKKQVANLDDRYVIHLITKRTNLRTKDIPKVYVDFVRTLMLAKKKIKTFKEEKKHENKQY